MKRWCLVFSALALPFVLVRGTLAEDPSSSARFSIEGNFNPVKTTWLRPRPVQRSVSRAARGTDGEIAASSFLSMNNDPEGDLPREVVVTPDGRRCSVTPHPVKYISTDWSAG